MDYRQVLPAKTLLDGKYRIDRVIGSGGFGITYEAFDVGLQTPVAVKEYFPDHFGIRGSSMSVAPRTEAERPQFDRWRVSFVQEARTLASFDHPAIVRVLSVFEAYGTAYMVMRYEDGPSLKAWLAEIKRAPTQAELDRMIGPMLDALEVVHDKRFLHRDISPDNIILRADGTPILIDFGATRRLVTDANRTMTGIVKNGYSPQEQYASDGRLQGPWTDIYALGATLYRCMAGKVPPESAERLLHDRMAPASTLAPRGYRPEFLAAVDAALRIKPGDRPQSIAAMRTMLFQPGIHPSAPHVSGSEPLAHAATTSGATTSGATTSASGQSAPGPHPSSRPSVPQPRSAPPSQPSQGRPSGPAHQTTPSRPVASSQTASDGRPQSRPSLPSQPAVRSMPSGPPPAGPMHFAQSAPPLPAQASTPIPASARSPASIGTPTRTGLGARIAAAVIGVALIAAAAAFAANIGGIRGGGGSAPQPKADGARRAAQDDAERTRLAIVQRADDERRETERRRIEDEAARRRADEARKADDARKAEETRRRVALERAQAEEARRVAEQQRIAAEAQKREADNARAALQQPPAAATIAAAEPTREQAKEQQILPPLASLQPPSVTISPAAEAAPNPAVLTRSIQKELLRVGCNPGPEDGIWGTSVRGALDQFARLTAASLKTDGPTPEALAALSKRRDRVCPLKCDPQEHEVAGRCVEKPVAAQPKPVISQPKPAAAAPQAKEEPKPERRAPPPAKRESASINSGGSGGSSGSSGGGGGGGGRRCNGFPRPRPGEACIGAGGRTCIAGGGAGSCS